MSDRIESPYVGLVPYREADAQFFFGREDDVRRVIARLFASRLTLLYGASGVGKSSLLRAGVVTELKQRAVQAEKDGERPDVLVVYFNRWQGDPLESFRVAVRRHVGDRLSADALTAALAEPTLTGMVMALINTLDSDLFVIFDQFEEFFLYHAVPGASGTFERDFADLATRPGLPVSLLISLRDDALSRLDHFKELIPNLFASYVRVTHLSPDAARRAIVEPVRAFNSLPVDQREWQATVSVEPALVNAVVNGVRTGRVAVGDIGRGQVTTDGEGVETPYLQLVMSELWRREHALGSTTLRTKTLQALGGAAAIVQNHLDTAVERLTPEDRDACALMFQYLVTPSGTKIAHTAQDLAGLAGRPVGEIELVLSKLSGSGMRILSPVAPPTDRQGPVRYEIYHDSLAQAILDWRRRYVTDRETAARDRERQEQERELQEEIERQRHDKLQAEQLAAAETARAEAETQRAVEQRRAARRFKMAASVAAAFAVLATAAMLVALYQRGLAVDARDQVARLEANVRDLANSQEGLIARYEAAAEQQKLVEADLRQKLTSAGIVAPPTPAPNTTELERLRAEAATLKAQLASYNAQASQGAPKDDGGAMKTLQAQLDFANKTVKDREFDLTRANNEVKRLTGELQTLRADNERLTKEIETRTVADGRVREVLAAYEAAHNSADVTRAVTQMAAVFPSYDGRQWAAARRDYSAYSLKIVPAGPIRYTTAIDGATLVTTMEQQYRLVGGTAQQRSVRTEFRFARQGESWLITGAVAAPAAQ
ncbi:MAG: hypothetical protein IT178_08765 [Acidobacteria bacterium]|nr:hypothetical protein [Acidobacteriota bacterium]